MVLATKEFSVTTAPEASVTYDIRVVVASIKVDLPISSAIAVVVPVVILTPLLMSSVLVAAGLIREQIVVDA